MNYKIDNLQYCKWSREVFQINREAGLDAVHVTLVYHEDYDEFINITKYKQLKYKLNKLKTICSTGSPLSKDSFNYVYEKIKIERRRKRQQSI